MRPLIRQATALDTPAIAAMRAAAWRETYTGVVPAEVLDGLCAPKAQARHADYWASLMIDQGAFFWVVTDADADGEIVGVANAMPSRDEDAPTALELTMIYLLQRAQGSGVAGPLLRTTIGDADCCLWVLDPNPRAQAFYRKHGFTPDGATLIPEGLGGVREIRMVRRRDADADSD